VRPVSIVDKNNYVNLARQRALDFNSSSSLDVLPSSSCSLSRSSSSQFTTAPSSPHPSPSLPLPTRNPFLDPPRALFANQFENLSNTSAHYTSTGPEIWRQTSGVIDAFVSGSGTGGTISGVGRYLKEMYSEVEIVLSDPQGSGLFHKVGEDEGWRRGG
jgi:cysteine synthase A